MGLPGTSPALAVGLPVETLRIPRRIPRKSNKRLYSLHFRQLFFYRFFKIPQVSLAENMDFCGQSKNSKISQHFKCKIFKKSPDFGFLNPFRGQSNQDQVHI
jgi:hypothetical protein